MQMTALELICSLSECSENVSDLVTAHNALEKLAALARYADSEMQVSPVWSAYAGQLGIQI